MSTMPFGKFKGVLIADLPGDYLQWLLSLGDGLREPLRSAVWAEWRKWQSPMDTMKALPVEAVDMGAKIIQIGYRRLAQECHPDHGGDGQTMTVLNLAMEALRAWLTTQRQAA